MFLRSSLRAVSSASAAGLVYAASSHVAAAPASANDRVSRIIRFEGTDGNVYMGEEPAVGATQATLLKGNLYDGSLARTDTKKDIRKLLSPVVPTNIFCIGLNYMKHYEESAAKRGIPLPSKPVIFMKPTTALAHPGEDVWIPQISHGDELDWEVELAVVIGKECRNVTADKALDYVLGYTVANDISQRYWQKEAGAGQWIKGKSFDKFAPLGPVLVTTAEISNPQNLQVKTRVNGKTQQNENTKDQIFTCAECIEWLSHEMTLAPGTVIMTGTPAGVAAGRSPPNWLVAGDVVEVEIENIGVLRNQITIPPDAKL